MGDAREDCVANNWSVSITRQDCLANKQMVCLHNKTGLSGKQLVCLHNKTGLSGKQLVCLHNKTGLSGKQLVCLHNKTGLSGKQLVCLHNKTGLSGKQLTCLHGCTDTWHSARPGHWRCHLPCKQHNATAMYKMKEVCVMNTDQVLSSWWACVFAKGWQFNLWQRYNVALCCQMQVILMMHKVKKSNKNILISQ